MGVTTKRIVGIVGFIAAVIAISVVIWPNQPDNPVLRAFSTFAVWVEGFRTFINEGLPELPPALQPYLQGYGDIFIIIVGVLVVVLLLYERERVPVWIRVLLKRFQPAQQPTSEDGTSPSDAGGPSQKPTSSTPWSFSSTEVINAPIEGVWESLRATNCGLTFEELLERVKISVEREDAVFWVGSGNLGDEDFQVEGTTRLSPPNVMDVECISGALKGFKATFWLREVPSGTRVRESVSFDFSSVASEFSTVAPKLSAVMSTVVEGELRKLRRMAETKALVSRERSKTSED